MGDRYRHLVQKNETHPNTGRLLCLLRFSSILFPGLLHFWSCYHSSVDCLFQDRSAILPLTQKPSPKPDTARRGDEEENEGRGKCSISSEREQ